jgi:phage tail-like protein
VYSFARVKNISESIEVESVREGGDNQHVHSLLKQRSSEQKIVFERGLLADPDGQADTELQPGTLVSNVQILVMSRGAIKKNYYFDEGLITKWEISGLDAMDGKPIYRTIEIIHSGLHEGKAP